MPEPPPKKDIRSKLLNVFTPEQVELLADLFERVQARAVERRSDQSVTVIFDDKGHPRHFNGSDNTFAPKPRTYLNE